MSEMENSRLAMYELQDLVYLFANSFFLNDIYRSRGNVLPSKKSKHGKISTFL